MLIYFLLLTVIAAVHGLYFGDPLSSLWFTDPYPPHELSEGAYRFELDVSIGGALGLLTVQVSRWLSAHATWAKKIDEDFAFYFSDQSSLSLTGLAVMSALCEEVIFRGWLQNIIGFTWASLIFGLLHVPPQRSHWPWTLSATVMGLIFGSLYIWRGSVTAPFIAHFTINYFNLHALSKLGRAQAVKHSGSA